ncbi:MAG: two-component regulator propeller domain-containing protein [Bacteroidota bacterium]
MRLYLLGLLAVLLGVPAPGHAQATRGPGSEIRFRHFGIEDGLASPYITAIYQDTRGFLWFGTEGGLSRYDGLRFRTYLPVPFDTTSLGEVDVEGFASTPDGGLWIAGEEGTLSRYHPQRDAFTNLLRLDRAAFRTLDVFIRARDGGLWLGGNEGVYRYEPDTGALDTFRQSDESGGLPSNRVTALLEDRRGGIWVGMEGGHLVRYDLDTARFEDISGPGGLPRESIRSLLEDRSGRLWVGTDEGLFLYDQAAGTFVAYDGTEGVQIMAIVEDPAGALWLGTDDGIAHLAAGAGPSAPAARYRHDPNDPASILPGRVRALYLDRSGVMWVGLFAGVSAFELAPPPFTVLTHDPEDPNSLSDPIVWSVLAQDSVLWVGTEDGVLNRVDRPSGRVTRYRHDGTDQAATATVVDLREAEDGTLWLGTWRSGSWLGTFQRFDPAQGRVVERHAPAPAWPEAEDWPRPNGVPGALPTSSPHGTFEDGRGRLWVLSSESGCPSVFNRAAGTFAPFCLGEEPGASPWVRSVVEHDGALWFGAYGEGLIRFDPDTGRQQTYSYDPANADGPASDKILVLHLRDGAIWVGTYGTGLSRFDPATEVFTHYSAATTDLPSDIIYSIEEDDAGDLWLGTGRGLARFSPATDTFEAFGLDDGLPDLDFNTVASHRAPSGELFFGGPGGLVSFFPDRLTRNEVPPPVAITNVRVGGEIAEPGEGAPLAVAAPYAETVRLAPGQRDLALAFAALHFANPSQNRYRYRLEGYDADWHTPGGDPEATYTNLDPGRYTFRVQAANADGVWNDEGAALAVVVEPRFFETWWFALGLGLLALGLAGAAVQGRVRRQRERETELRALVAERTADLEREKQTTEAQAEQLRELDAAKTRFFQNVSHEFRTPLTLTIGPLEDLRDGMYAPDEIGEPVGLALRSARRVLGLINEILDVAKMDARQLRLGARPLDLDAFLRDLAAMFALHAERLGIDLRYDGPGHPVEAWLDRDRFGRAVSNLLSNALKFTPDGGRVRLRLAASETEARVTVEDTGTGIAAEHLPYLFDRFYQADGLTPQRQPGTGIGLAFAREVVTLHGGTIAAESEPGAGSRFTITLPLGRDHLAPDQLAGDEQPGDAAVPDVPPLLDPSLLLPDQGGDERPSEASTLSEDGAGEDVTTVLVVDDHPDIRAYVRRHLEAERDGHPGYRVLEAADGAEGLALAREHLPDLVVSDVMMPVLDGIALCTALKADPATDFLPVVLLTAKAGEEATLEGLGSGADDYVTKPFNVRTLAARVDNLIAGRRRLRERFAGEAVPAPARPDTSALAPEDAALVERLHAVIEDRLDDEDFGVETLAEAVGMSRATLYRRLKGVVDETPQALLREARLARAARLLTERAGGVGEIAYAVGFKSVAHFSRTFRATYEVAPSAYAAPAGA